MLSGINTYQPSFKGMYIIKGKACDVENACAKIYKKCEANFEKYTNQTVKYPQEIEFLHLNKIYDDEQPLIHALIATDNHAVNIRNWYRTMVPAKKDTLKEKMEEVEIHRTQNGVIITGDFRAIFKAIKARSAEIRAQMEEFAEGIKAYKRAKTAEENGKPDLMSDFIIDSMNMVKQRLQEVRDLASVPYKEPKKLDAEEVIKAVDKNRFDYVSGEIKA